MSQHVSCPNCAAVLKPTQLPPLGTKVKCPKCQQTFRLDASNVGEMKSPGRGAPTSTSRPVMPQGAMTQPVWPQAAGPIQPSSATYDSPPMYAAHTAAHAPTPLHHQGVPAWAWAAGGALTAAIVLLIALTVAGVFDGRAEQPVAIANQPVVVKAPANQNRSPAAANHQAASPFEGFLNPTQPADSFAAEDENSPARPIGEPPVSPAEAVRTPEDSGKRRAPAEGLEFALDPDKTYAYQFEVNSGDAGNGPIKINGSVSYHLEPARAQPPTVIDEAFKAKRVGSGTAFVVNSAGWMVTCAHVVNDATKTEVVLGKRTFTAKVKEVDDAHDLALLKIDTDDLRALPVAGAAPAQGDDVNVAGFPLTTMLGDSLKITHGRIAGFVDRKGEHYIQIDASVNPGNSGGPLLNAEGEVIGVVNAGLFGADISAVGLSVDLAPLRALLQRHQVNWQVGSGGSALAGNTLADQVRSAIARVRVEIEPAKPKEQLRVRYTGNVMAPKQQSKFANGIVSISPQGEVVSVEGQNDYFLVSTATSGLAFDRLPSAGQREWHASRQRQVVATEHEDTDLPFGFPGGPRFGPPGLRRFGGPRFGISPFDRQPDETAKGTRVSIEDELSYEIEELTDDKAVVNTTFTSLRTEEPSGKTWGRIAGAGQYTFDRTQGMITSGFSEMKLKANLDGIEAMVPLRIAYKLRDALTSQEMKDRAEKARVQAAESDAKRKADEGQRLIQVIAALKAANDYTADNVLRQTLGELNSLGNDLGKSDQREEVGPLLNRYLKHNDEWIRSSALSAAANWATAANIPTLMELLQTQDIFRRADVIRGLGAAGGDEKSATVLAKLLETDARHDAVEGLKRMKKFAEAATLPMLLSSNSDARQQACEVLGEVGGRKSFDALTELVAKTGEHGFESVAAKIALDKVKQHLAVQPDAGN